MDSKIRKSFIISLVLFIFALIHFKEGLYGEDIIGELFPSLQYIIMTILFVLSFYYLFLGIKSKFNTNVKLEQESNISWKYIFTNQFIKANYYVFGLGFIFSISLFFIYNKREFDYFYGIVALIFLAIYIGIVFSISFLQYFVKK